MKYCLSYPSEFGGFNSHWFYNMTTLLEHLDYLVETFRIAEGPIQVVEYEESLELAW